MTIVYEGERHYVARVPTGFEVYRHTATASERVARYGRGNIYFARAVEDCKQRDAKSQADS